MSILLFLAAATAPAVEAGQSLQPRQCSPGARSSSQIAYKPYGGPVFGADGLTCSSAKAAAETRLSRKIPERAQRSAAVLRGLAHKP